jgi:hypothetical protein
MPKTAASAGATVDRAERICAAYKPKATTIKYVLIHILGNAVLGGSGAQAGTLGQRASAMDLVHIHE